MRTARTARDVARAGRNRARRLLRGRRPRFLRGTPAVSIVLPIYNVEEYLRECLDSILEQDFGDFEVVVVDDGSPDGSLDIVTEYARRDRRIRIVRRPNGGLGAARNTGVRHAKGTYLMFVDSDDTLPQGAVGAMVASAEQSGSDIVVGAIHRFNKSGIWRPQWLPAVHSERRTATTITEFPALLRNLYSCDKLFRRDFFARCDLWFREGVAYEDQPLITQLYSRAARIDVLPDVVYLYRSRDDKSSISQQTSTLRDLRDRIAAWRVSRETLRAEVSRDIYEGWLQTHFDAHFLWYLRSPGTSDDQYWAELREAVAELTADAPQTVWDATLPGRRVLIELAVQDRRDDAQEFLRRGGERWGRFPASLRDDGVLVHLPFSDDPDLDDGLFVMHPEQLSLAHSVERVEWCGAGQLSIAGWAYIRLIDTSQHESSVNLVLRNERSGQQTVFACRGGAEPAYAPPAEDDWVDYRGGTFETRIGLDEVLATGQPGDVFEASLQVTTVGMTLTRPVTNIVRSGSAGVIPATVLASGDRIVAEWRLHEPLRFRLVPLTLQASGLRLDGRVLSGVVSGPRSELATEVRVGGPRLTAGAAVERRADGSRSFRATLPTAEPVQPGQIRSLPVSVALSSGERVALSLPESPQFDQVQTTPAGAVALQSTRLGELAVAEWQVAAYAETLETTASGAVRVTGRVFGPVETSLALRTRNKKTVARGDEAPVREGRFEAEILLRHQVYRFGDKPLPLGNHDVLVTVRTPGEDDPVEVPLRVSRELSDQLPVVVRTHELEGRFVRGPDGGVRLSLVRPIGDARGPFLQNRFRSGEAPSVEGGIRRCVLMRSYFGESATDNGVAIQRELARRGADLEVFWAVQDHSTPLPEGSTPVIKNSREWYDLLGSAKYYIDNMYQPEYHRKPQGQVIVQTFHGYPFKSMGHPHWDRLQVSRERIDAYDARARDWDYLVSPARYATPLLKRDFAYDGQVLEIGYPRNDVLLGTCADHVRQTVRRSLGISDSQKAILYAPTFRDYMSSDDNRARMPDFFDFELATQALGDDYVILVRGHAFNARSSRRVGSRRGVVDVTDYPEVSDLYLASDAAVVDYSSLRFDFGVTGKPMVFLVPDLDRYNDTRGWLVDFEPTAPGPLVETTDAVVESLRDLDELTARYEKEYATFRADYLDLEDGHAASRFVDAVFVPRGDAPPSR